jgi:phenylacetate-CoA ligase
MRWLDTPESWDWVMKCWGIIYRAIGLRDDDRVFFPFSFGPFLGFWAGFDGAARLGNLVLPGGGMSSAARLSFMIENEATVIGCTPTYALRLSEVAAEEGIDIAASKVRAVIVAGEPGGNIPETKQRIEETWGARCFDHTGMTEIGSLGIECVEDKGNTHLIASECIPELIDSDSAEPVPEGESGELVITVLGRWGSPLIRYRTGDRVRLIYERCTCGRSFPRMAGGILGRLDDMMFIRGNNIYPSAIEAVVRRFPEVAEFRMQQVTEGSMNSLKLDIEPAPEIEDASALAADLTDAVKRQFNFLPQIEIVAHGSLPRFELKARRLVK